MKNIMKKRDISIHTVDIVTKQLQRNFRNKPKSID